MFAGFVLFLLVNGKNACIIRIVDCNSDHGNEWFFHIWRPLQLSYCPSYCPLTQRWHTTARRTARKKNSRIIQILYSIMQINVRRIKMSVAFCPPGFYVACKWFLWFFGNKSLLRRHISRRFFRFPRASTFARSLLEYISQLDWIDLYRASSRLLQKAVTALIANSYINAEVMTKVKYNSDHWCNNHSRWIHSL